MEAVINPNYWYKAKFTKLIEKESQLRKGVILWTCEFTLRSGKVVYHTFSEEFPDITIPFLKAVKKRFFVNLPTNVDFNKLIGRELRLLLDYRTYNNKQYIVIKKFKRV